MIRPPPTSTLFPYTTLFRSCRRTPRTACTARSTRPSSQPARRSPPAASSARSEEHTSELQSPYDLVCRLLLEKKKKKRKNQITEQDKKRNNLIRQGRTASHI